MSEAYKKILVPTDGSPGSEAVFPAIMPLVRAYSPEVAVLHVLENHTGAFVPPERISTACAALRTAGVNAHLELREGVPAEEILLAAKAQKVDLIAISTQGRGGIARWIAGSVAEAVLRKTDVPLLITRPSTMVHDWKTVVVALDGSGRAEEILPDAVRLARTLGASIEVLQVAFPIVAGVIGSAPVTLPIEDPMPYLRKVVAQLEAQGLKASAVAPEGNASREILRHLKETAASILCMTTHGRSGLSRLFLGSVAEEILRHSPCPVLLRRIVTSDADLMDAVPQGITVY